MLVYKLPKNLYLTDMALYKMPILDLLIYIIPQSAYYLCILHVASYCMKENKVIQI
jgi:hypothetical protein